MKLNFDFSGSNVIALIHKNRVELDGMLEDPMFSVVFNLNYIVGEPITQKDRRVSYTDSVQPWALNL